MNRLNPAAIIACTALLLPLSSFAQEVSLMDQAADATCASFLAPLLGKKEIAQLTVHRSIESRAVCSCTKTRMREDALLSQMYSLDKAHIEEKLRDQQVFSMRWAACSSPFWRASTPSWTPR